MKLHDGHLWMLEGVKTEVEKVFWDADGIIAALGTEDLHGRVTDREAELAQAIVKIHETLGEYHIPANASRLHDGHLRMLRKCRGIIDGVYDTANDVLSSLGTERAIKVTKDEVIFADAITDIKEILYFYFVAMF